MSRSVPRANTSNFSAVTICRPATTKFFSRAEVIHSRELLFRVVLKVHPGICMLAHFPVSCLKQWAFFDSVSQGTAAGSVPWATLSVSALKLTRAALKNFPRSKQGWIWTCPSQRINFLFSRHCAVLVSGSYAINVLRSSITV